MKSEHKSPLSHPESGNNFHQALFMEFKQSFGISVDVSGKQSQQLIVAILDAIQTCKKSEKQRRIADIVIWLNTHPVGLKIFFQLKKIVDKHQHNQEARLLWQACYDVQMDRVMLRNQLAQFAQVIGLALPRKSKNIFPEKNEGFWGQLFVELYQKRPEVLEYFLEAFSPGVLSLYDYRYELSWQICQALTLLRNKKMVNKPNLYINSRYQEHLESLSFLMINTANYYGWSYPQHYLNDVHQLQISWQQSFAVYAESVAKQDSHGFFCLSTAGDMANCRPGFGPENREDWEQRFVLHTVRYGAWQYFVEKSGMFDGEKEEVKNASLSELTDRCQQDYHGWQQDYQNMNGHKKKLQQCQIFLTEDHDQVPTPQKKLLTPQKKLLTPQKKLLISMFQKKLPELEQGVKNSMAQYKKSTAKYYDQLFLANWFVCEMPSYYDVILQLALFLNVPARAIFAEKHDQELRCRSVTYSWLQDCRLHQHLIMALKLEAIPDYHADAMLPSFWGDCDLTQLKSIKGQLFLLQQVQNLMQKLPEESPLLPIFAKVFRALQTSLFQWDRRDVFCARGHQLVNDFEKLSPRLSQELSQAMAAALDVLPSYVLTAMMTRLLRVNNPQKAHLLLMRACSQVLPTMLGQYFRAGIYQPATREKLQSAPQGTEPLSKTLGWVPDIQTIATHFNAMLKVSNEDARYYQPLFELALELDDVQNAQNSKLFFQTYQVNLLSVIERLSMLSLFWGLMRQSGRYHNQEADCQQQLQIAILHCLVDCPVVGAWLLYRFKAYQAELLQHRDKCVAGREKLDHAQLQELMKRNREAQNDHRQFSQSFCWLVSLMPEGSENKQNLVDFLMRHPAAIVDQLTHGKLFNLSFCIDALPELLLHHMKFGSLRSWLWLAENMVLSEQQKQYICGHKLLSAYDRHPVEPMLNFIAGLVNANRRYKDKTALHGQFHRVMALAAQSLIGLITGKDTKTEDFWRAIHTYCNENGEALAAIVQRLAVVLCVARHNKLDQLRYVNRELDCSDLPRQHQNEIIWLTLCLTLAALTARLNQDDQCVKEWFEQLTWQDLAVLRQANKPQKYWRSQVECLRLQHSKYFSVLLMFVAGEKTYAPTARLVDIMKEQRVEYFACHAVAHWVEQGMVRAIERIHGDRQQQHQIFKAWRTVVQQQKVLQLDSLVTRLVANRALVMQKSALRKLWLHAKFWPKDLKCWLQDLANESIFLKGSTAVQLLLMANNLPRWSERQAATDLDFIWYTGLGENQVCDELEKWDWVKEYKIRKFAFTKFDFLQHKQTPDFAYFAVTGEFSGVPVDLTIVNDQRRDDYNTGCTSKPLGVDACCIPISAIDDCGQASMAIPTCARFSWSWLLKISDDFNIRLAFGGKRGLVYRWFKYLSRCEEALGRFTGDLVDFIEEQLTKLRDQAKSFLSSGGEKASLQAQITNVREVVAGESVSAQLLQQYVECVIEVQVSDSDATVDFLSGSDGDPYSSSRSCSPTE